MSIAIDIGIGIGIVADIAIFGGIGTCIMVHWAFLGLLIRHP